MLGPRPRQECDYMESQLLLKRKMVLPWQAAGLLQRLRPLISSKVRASDLALPFCVQMPLEHMQMLDNVWIQEEITVLMAGWLAADSSDRHCNSLQILWSCKHKVL